MVSFSVARFGKLMGCKRLQGRSAKAVRAVGWTAVRGMRHPLSKAEGWVVDAAGHGDPRGSVGPWAL